MTAQFQKCLVGLADQKEIEVAGNQETCQCQRIDSGNQSQDENNRKNQFGTPCAEDEEPVSEDIFAQSLQEVDLVFFQKADGQVRVDQFFGPGQYSQGNPCMNPHNRQGIGPAAVVLVRLEQKKQSDSEKVEVFQGGDKSEQPGARQKENNHQDSPHPDR